MELRKRFIDTISKEEKNKVCDLYFNKFYSYAQLEYHFRGKYTYAQLKDIIRERIRSYDGN